MVNNYKVKLEVTSNNIRDIMIYLKDFNPSNDLDTGNDYYTEYKDKGSIGSNNILCNYEITNNNQPIKIEELSNINYNEIITKTTSDYHFEDSEFIGINDIQNITKNKITSIRFIPKKIQKCKKEHFCGLCNGIINIGDSYILEECSIEMKKYDGVYYNWRAYRKRHDTCYQNINYIQLDISEKPLICDVCQSSIFKDSCYVKEIYKNYIIKNRHIHCHHVFKKEMLR